MERTDSQQEQKYLQATRQLAVQSNFEPVNKKLPHEYFCCSDEHGSPSATAVLYTPESLFYKGEPCAFFGNFISLNDQSAFENILIELEEHARAKGAKWLIGPMNGSTWEQYRWALDASEPLFPSDIFTPNFYPKRIQNCGFELLAEYVTNRDDNLFWNEESIKTKKEKHKDKNLTIRTLNKNNLNSELQKIHQLCMDSFQDNFLYSPLSEADFFEKYAPLVEQLPDGFVWVAESMPSKEMNRETQTETIGFLFAFPNAFDTQKKGAIIKTLARKKDPNFRGIAPLLAEAFYKTIRAAGIDYVYHAFMEANNFSNKTSKTFSGETIKRYGLFGKRI